jgi:type II secretory pathway component PulF
MLVKQQAVVQNFCTELEGFIKKGFELRKALNAVVPVYNRATPEQQIEMRDEVAKLIGRLKGVKPKRLESGAYKGHLGFDAHGTDTENQARTMLQYYFPISIKKKKGSSPQPVAKQVDEVTELLKKLYALSKKEQERFHLAYSNDRKARAK